jgi:hypothetical protein
LPFLAVDNDETPVRSRQAGAFRPFAPFTSRTALATKALDQAERDLEGARRRLTILIKREAIQMTVERIEARMREERTAGDEAKREVAELQNQRKKLLLAGDIDAIEELDRRIRRLGISVEIVEAKSASLNGDLHLARAERQRWANVASTSFTMPDHDELARLIEIVREAEPDLRFDDDEFRRAFWACGQMWRTDSLSRERYFVSFVDDGSDLLRMRRQSSISGASFLAAIIAHGDVFWQRADPGLGVVLSAALDKNHGRPCSNRWRDIVAGDASLLEPIYPAGQRAGSSTYPHRGVTIYREGPDGSMCEVDPNTNSWMQ